MATIEIAEALEQIESEIRAMPDAGLIAQSLVQQGAIHAVSWLLSNGCNEASAVEMLASLRSSSELLRQEATRRGKPHLFERDQLASDQPHLM